MCVTPHNIPDLGFAACRNCWQCRNNRVNDLVGRCIAEQNVSDAVFSVTLTYADDVPNAAVLVYKDVQDFLKRLRKDYSVRYIIAGEYGSQKGRAHWHAILFFRGTFPDLEHNRRINWEYWPHGFSYFQSPDYGGLKYVLKYVLKDQDRQRVHRSHLAMSKKPPLGNDYFMMLARQHVQQGLAPLSPEYSFRDHTDDTGKRRKFWLQGRMRTLYLNEYVRSLSEKFGLIYCHDPKRGHHLYGAAPQASEFLQDHEDKSIAYYKGVLEPHKVALDEPTPAPIGEDEVFHHGGKSYTEIGYFVQGDMLISVLNDGSMSVSLAEGEKEWHVETVGQLAEVLKRAEPNAHKRWKMVRALYNAGLKLQSQLSDAAARRSGSQA